MPVTAAPHPAVAVGEPLIIVLTLAPVFLRTKTRADTEAALAIRLVCSVTLRAAPLLASVPRTLPLLSLCSELGFHLWLSSSSRSTELVM
eukprot:9315759-Pyramimonas_sp.AAC.1